MTSQQRQKLRDLQVAAVYMPRGLPQEILGFSTRRQATLTTEEKVLLLLTGLILAGAVIAYLYYGQDLYSTVY
jgi:hypothetical protein